MLGLTCHFQYTLRGMGDGGCDPHRGVAALLEGPRMAQGLGLLQLPFGYAVLTPRRLLGAGLPPLAGGLRLQAARVVGAAVRLVVCLAVLAVPGEAALHQRALLRVRAQLGAGGGEKTP